MTEVLRISNPDLATKTGLPYNTVASWKFKYKHNLLSLEKQIEILTRLGYEPQTNLKWRKKDTVIRRTANGTFDSNYGTMYKFEIEMQNGDTGEYASKDPNPKYFTEGQEQSYEVIPREYNGNTYYKMKPVMAKPMGGGYSKDPDTDKRITRMSVLKVAGDLAIAGKIQLHETTSIAQLLEQFVITGNDTLASLKDDGKGLPF